MSVTSIEWTEMTWNPITGCSKCSEGCLNCYADRFARRLHAMGVLRYQNGFKVTVHRDLFTQPLSWKKPKMIFVNSMSDIFHEDLPEKDILDLFCVMNKANWHIFQILTKRADRMLQLSSKINWTNNIWMGVTVESNSFVYRSELLKKTNAHVKFISAEPLLGPLHSLNLNGIDWLIVGGESGPHCRSMEKEWVIELRDLAQQTKTPFFFKQWGGTRKKKTGNLLDGENYKEYPLQEKQRDENGDSSST